MNKTLTLCLYFVLFLCLFSTTALAQRIYGTSQQTGASGLVCLNCTVTNPANAADGNPQTYSQLNVTVGLAAQTFQDIIFPGPIAANTPVSLKIGTGDNLVDLTALGGLSVRPYNGATPAGPAVEAATLVTAANNNNQQELTITPGLVYDRVRVILDGGLAGVLSSIYLYDVYYKGTGPVPCSSPVDELHGISSALLGLGLGIGGVENPQSAIDGNIATFSTLNAGVGLLNATAQQTIIFNSTSVIGDSIVLTTSIPQALIDAGVLARISVSTFNGATSNNDSRDLSSALLRVRLLDLNNSRRTVTVSFAPSQVFDRVQLTLGGGIANVLSSVNLHEAIVKIPIPVISFNGSAALGSIQVCSGTTATFSAAPIANTVFNWYTAPSGGTIIFTGNTFTTPPLSTATTYYVEAQRSGCTDASARVSLSIGITPLPAVPVSSASGQTICEGSSATFNVQPVSGVTVRWYAAATGGTALFTGNTFTTPALTSTTSYYAEATGASGCVSSGRLQVTATVTPAPSAPVIAAPTVVVNSGANTTIAISNPQPGITYNWYTTATGGTPVASGTTFTTPGITSNSSYYAEAVSGNCSSGSRTLISISVNGAPDVTVSPATIAVNAGQSASFTASSSTPNAIFNWYTTPTAGTPIFTGSVFTTPATTSNTTYYAAAIDPATNASSARATATVIVNGSPDITVTPPSTTINSGESTSFTATSNTPGATFNWYTTPSGGSPIFSGATYNTPQITSNTTYYAEATDPATNARSTRASAMIIVNGTPDITITPPTRSVNAGETTTFTASSSLPGATFNWYNGPDGASPIFTGPTFTTPAITANTTYYAEAVNPSTNTTSPKAPASVTVNGAPDVSVNPPSRNINPGQSTSFTASSTLSGAVFNWYNTEAGGSPIFTGATYTTPTLNSNTTYYVQAVDPATGAMSARASASVTINGRPDLAINPPSRTINPGETATFTASSSTPNAMFNWYTQQSGGVAIYNGPVFTTPATNSNTTFYAEAVNPSTNATSDRAAATVSVNGAPDITVTPPTRNVNAGETTTFTASSTTPGTTFNWYSAPDASTPVYTGAVFTTPAITGNSTFYAEAVNPSTNASSDRVSAAVTVNGIPDLVITPPVRNVNAGETTTFTGSSTTPGATFNWYDNPESNTPIYSGPVFTTPAITGNTTFYGEAVNPSTGASSDLVAASVVINGAPDVTVIPRVRDINSGQTTVFTASSTTPGAIFNWYSTPSGGIPLYTGPDFRTPALTTNTTFYATATNPSTNAVSERTAATVTINAGGAGTGGAPDLTVTPPSITIPYGVSATFTASSTTPGAVFNWYTAASGGTPVFTGASFTTPVLKADVTYYAEAVNPATSISSSRLPASVKINVIPDVTITPATVTVDAGQTTTLTASSSTPGVTFYWYNSPTDKLVLFRGPAYTTPKLSSGTTYYAEAVNEENDNVSSRASAVVNVNNAVPMVYVPNAFSPNADGNNDMLMVYGSAISSFNINIYNQWGQVIFRSNDKTKGWDGSWKGVNQPVGVYVYTLEVVTGGEKILKKGTITLLR